jgi:transposase
MQLQTILNRVTDYKSFVFGKVRWLEGESPVLEIELQPRANGRPVCSGCGKVRPGYDRSSEPRRFEHVPLW